MSKWETKELQYCGIDIIDGDRGTNYPSREEFQPEGYCLFLSTSNIVDDKFQIDTGDFITEQKDSLLRKGKLIRDDIVLTTRGTVGSVAYYHRRIPYEHMRINSGMVILRCDKTFEPLFLYHLCKSSLLKQQYALFASGSAQPQLPIKDMKRIKLNIPPLPIQRKIAAILSAYDDLIENNTRRIALLEKMAEEVYREWFVRLRFPGYERVPVHHGIPDGWAMLEIKDLIKRVPAGKLYSDATALPNGSIPILDQGRSGIIGYHNDEPSVIASMENPVIVFANHTCNQRIIWFPFSAIQNVLPFVPSENLSRNIYWLHYAIVGQVNINSYKGHYPEFIAKQILVPSADLAEQFGIMSMRNFQMIVSLREANEKLKATRDMLLSRLLSGKVEVENLEIAFPVGMQGAE